MKCLGCLLAVVATTSLLFLTPAFAGTIPSGLTATINLTNFTFASDFEADTFSARNYGMAINDSYLDVNTTYFLTLNITNFTTDIYNFTANSTTATNPTNFTAKMRNPSTRYNLKANGVFSQEITTDSYGNATWQYDTWTLTPIRFLFTTCLESWSYADWSSCSYGYQSRIATESNSCGTAYNRSEVSRACSTATSGGGGGSGGGSLSEGTPSTKPLAFFFPAAPVLKISATVLYTLPEPQNVTISYPTSIPLSIPQAPGLAYSFLEIVPTFNSSQYLIQAQIDFEVNKSWYSKNEIALGSTVLLRYDGQFWRSLPTVQIGEDSASYLFQSNTTSFSLFAIAGTKRPKAQPPSAVTTTTSLPPTPIMQPGTPTTSSIAPTTPRVAAPSVIPQSTWAFAIVLLSIILIILVYLKKKSRPPEPQLKPGAQVTIKGIVTSIGLNDFDVFDGTWFISVRYGKEFPPLASRVEVKGTLSRSDGKTYIAATSVRQI